MENRLRREFEIPSGKSKNDYFVVADERKEVMLFDSRMAFTYINNSTKLWKAFRKHNNGNSKCPLRNFNISNSIIVFASSALRLRYSCLNIILNFLKKILDCCRLIII